MSNPEYVEPETRGRSWKDVLIADRWRLVGVGVVVALIALYVGYKPEVPRWLRLFVVAGFIAAIIGYPFAARIVAWLYSPNWTFLVDLDARTNEFAVWQLPPSAWRDLEVTDGELYPVQSTAPAWECKHYDPEQNACEGTWRGSASDLELIEDRERIDEIRGVLEDLAKEGLTIRVKQSGIVRTAVTEIAHSLLEGFESETVYDGGQIEKAVDKALDRWQEDQEEPGAVGPGDDGTDTEMNMEPTTNGADGTAEVADD